MENVYLPVGAWHLSITKVVLMMRSMVISINTVKNIHLNVSINGNPSWLRGILSKLLMNDVMNSCMVKILFKVQEGPIYFNLTK